jgi:hypothetical protein
MMQPDFTTVSSPKAVDGYLALMIGTSLWKGCFQDNSVESAAEFVVETIGDNAKHIEDFVVFVCCIIPNNFQSLNICFAIGCVACRVTLC